MTHLSNLVRRYEDADEAAVITVWQRAGAAAYVGLREPFTWDQTAAVFREHVRPVAEIWVAVSDGIVVGFIALKGSSINRLYVDPTFWRQGWATRLVDVAKERRPRFLTVETDPKPQPAGHFYEANGFEAVRFHKSEPPDSEESVVYEWNQIDRSGDKVRTLNSGLVVADVGLASEQVVTRNALLDRLRVGLSSHDRVGAVWAHGSLGRGDEDALSDIDLIVMAAEGASDAFVASLPDFVARFGEVVLVNHMPGNAPEGGYFVSVLYDVEPLPTICDWSVWPFGTTRPSKVVTLYEGEPARFTTGGTYDQLMSGVPHETALLDGSAELNSRLYMVMAIAKDAARGWSESVEIMREYLPFEFPRATSMADTIGLLRDLVDDHAGEDPPGVAPAMLRYLSGIERLLPVELRR